MWFEHTELLTTNKHGEVSYVVAAVETKTELALMKVVGDGGGGEGGSSGTAAVAAATAAVAAAAVAAAVAAAAVVVLVDRVVLGLGPTVDVGSIFF